MTLRGSLVAALIACVSLAPLPLGGNRPWAWSALALAMAVLLAVWAAGSLRDGTLSAVSFRRIRAIALPFLAVAGWMAFQTLPLGGLLANPLWPEAAAALAADGVGPASGAISLTPYEGWTALMRLAAYGAAFWLALQLARQGQAARLIVLWLAIACVLYACLGLVYHHAGIERILWIEKWAYLGDATGSFVNRNAYGAQMALGLILCLTLCLRALRRRNEEAAVERLRRVTIGAWWLLAAGLCLMALLASHSRGALLAAVAAVLVLVLALAISGAIRPRTLLLAVAVMLLAGLAVFVVEGEETLRRFAEGASDFRGDRPNLVRLSWVLVQGAPWTGYGLGSFEQAFAMVRDTSLPRPVVYDYAHNMYSELFVEVGLPAGVIWLAGFAALAWRCLRGLRARRRGRFYPALGLAVLALFGGHSLVDFSIAMPALALTVAVLMGTVCAQSWSSRDNLAE